MTNLIYRNYTAADVDGIIAFWNENSGWETNLDRGLFASRFCSSPWGDPIMMLAIDGQDGLILGLCCFIPLQVSINGRVSRCYRPFGAVLRETFRRRYGLASLLTGTHPILQLYRHGARQALQEHAALTYMIPDHRWRKLARVMPFKIHSFPMWSYQVPRDGTRLWEEAIATRPVDPADPALDVLARETSRPHGCALVRDSQFFQWKIKVRGGGLRLRGLYCGDSLVGLFSLHFKAAERQWLIADVSTRDDGEYLGRMLKGAVQAAVAAHGDTNQRDEKPYKVSVLAHAEVEPEVRALGFYKDAYDYYLAVHLLNGGFSSADVAPADWAIGAND